MHAMAYGTSLVALSLSLLGILNTVWMSVLERTRDLGVLRAGLVAPPRDADDRV